MIRWLPLGILSALATLAGHAAHATDYFTRPSCWNDSRLFHADETYRDLAIERVRGELGSEALLSPNGGYRFELVTRHPESEPPWDADLVIYNERPYLLRLRLPDLAWPQSAEARWVNEKLLFVRAWWGRVAGTDLIVDVEREVIVLEEAVLDGGIAFQQFQQCDDPAGREPERCLCFPGAPEDWRPLGFEERAP